MKNLIYKIVIILSLLLTLIIIFIGTYIGVPGFRDKIINSLPKVKVTKVQSEEVREDEAMDSGAAINTDEAVLYQMPDNISGESSDAYDPNTSPVDIATPADIAAYLAPDISSGYTAPSETALDIPDALMSKTGGYDPVKPDEVTLTDPEADVLESSLDYGNTGDGLDFDPLMYPYYAMIDDTSKELYRQIYANALDLYDDFKAVRSDVTPSQIRNAFTSVFNDHPELFYLDTRYRAAFRGNGDCIEFKLYFNSLADDIDAAREQFEAAAASIPTSGSQYDSEKAAHDALADMDVYSLAAPYNQSAYSALINGSTVCAGYSRAMQYVMQRAGIPCYYCTGYAGENHAWNIICLDGDFYNLDVTWDDTDSAPAYNYDWFNRTDADYGTTHIRKDLSVYLPACNGTKYRGPDTDDSLRSLEDTGLSESDVIYDLDAYYRACLEQMVSLGMGNHIFRLAVCDRDLCAQIAAAYNGGDADVNALKPALSQSGAVSVNMNVYPEELSDGRYLLEHRYSMN